MYTHAQIKSDLDALVLQAGGGTPFVGYMRIVETLSQIAKEEVKDDHIFSRVHEVIHTALTSMELGGDFKVVDYEDDLTRRARLLND